MLTYLTTRCKRCFKQKPPNEIQNLPGGANICLDCMVGHEKAMKVFAGAIPDECQGCNVPVDVLARAFPGDTFEMTLTYKDGIYQVLCRQCRDKYYRLRKEFFQGTEYGEKHKLTGGMK